MYVSDDEFKKRTGSLTVCPCDDYGDIAKKQYMGSVNMQGAYVTDITKCIGSWAFAYCDKIEEIWFPARSISFDKTIFLDDKRLKKVVVYDRLLNGYNISDEEKHLLAIELINCYEESKYDFSKVGCDCWYADFDKALISYVISSDEKGFNPFLAGGEEDYDDPLNDIEFYKRSIRINKASAILERLMVKRKPDAALWEISKSFLCEHFDEAMEAIMKKNSMAYKYLRLYMDVVKIDTVMTYRALEVFSESKFAECRSLLISAGKAEISSNGIWDAFDL